MSSDTRDRPVAAGSILLRSDQPLGVLVREVAGNAGVDTASYRGLALCGTALGPAPERCGIFAGANAHEFNLNSAPLLLKSSVLRPFLWTIHVPLTVNRRG